MAYRAVLVTVLVGIAFFIADSVWKFYIAPGDALLSIVNRCSEEANEGLRASGCDVEKRPSNERFQSSTCPTGLWAARSQFIVEIGRITTFLNSTLAAGVHIARRDNPGRVLGAHLAAASPKKVRALYGSTRVGAAASFFA
jgi:hypothetical protein